MLKANDNEYELNRNALYRLFFFFFEKDIFKIITINYRYFNIKFNIFYISKVNMMHKNWKTRSEKFKLTNMENKKINPKIY